MWEQPAGASGGRCPQDGEGPRAALVSHACPRACSVPRQQSACTAKTYLKLVSLLCKTRPTNCLFPKITLYWFHPKHCRQTVAEAGLTSRPVQLLRPGRSFITSVDSRLPAALEHTHQLKCCDFSLSSSALELPHALTHTSVSVRSVKTCLKRRKG